MGNSDLYERLKKVADDYYAGRITPEALAEPSENNRFAGIIKQYKEHVDNLAKYTSFRWYDYPVISEQFPPVNSEIEKNFLINSMLHSPIAQRSITVAVSYGCKCNCKQCYRTEYMDPGRKELTVEQFGSLFKKVTDLGAWHIDITGGEPFDHPRFFEIMEQIPKDKATTMVATNGINLDESTVERIKASNIMVLKVSLDSYRKSDHDKNRAVADAYDHVVRGIKLALKNNIYVFIQAFVERDCWKDNELEKRIQVCLELGIKKFHIITPLNIGNLSNRQDLLLTLKDREYIYALKDKYKQHDIRINVFPDWELHKGCLAGRGRIYINPYGDIYPCNFDNKKVYGNILTDELPEVVEAIQKDIQGKRRYCVASNVTLDMLEKLGVEYDVHGKQKSSFNMLNLFRPDRVAATGER